MGVFEQIRAVGGHEQVLFCNDPEVGLKAIIAVHNTALGPALGGLRMWHYANEDEALTDVLRLSRGMTYKAAVAGLNLGGGKAVIIGDPRTQKTEALFRSFGRQVQSLSGRYITAEDVGTSTREMTWIHMETKHVTGLSPEEGGSGDPSPVTALGVFSGILGCLDAKFGSADLKGRSVAIQGLGNVGFYLARYLRDAGAKVFGCDINPDRERMVHDQLGVEIIAGREFFELEVDVLSPCALGAILDDESIEAIKAPIVAGGANNQLKDEIRHGKAVKEKGLIYAPDYVINAGGLINVYSEIHHLPREWAQNKARNIREVVGAVLDVAGKDNITTTEASNRLAERRVAMATHLRRFHL